MKRYIMLIIMVGVVLFSACNVVYASGISDTETELTYEEKSKIKELESDINNDGISKWSYFRIAVIVFGILVIVYSIIIFIAYFIDRFNVFFDISILSLVTMGHLMTRDELNTVETEDDNGRKVKYVGLVKLLVLCILGVLTGVLLITGKINVIIYEIIKLYKKII